MSDLTLSGKILVIYPKQQVNDRFAKREFVLELTEEINGNTYTNYAKMQTVQAKCDLLDRFSEGEDVTVNFNVKGNRWEKDGVPQFITNLDVWRIQSAATNTPANYSQNAQDTQPGLVTNAPSQPAPVPNGQSGTPEEESGLPF